MSPLSSLLLPFSSYPVVASPGAGRQRALPILLPHLLLEHSCQGCLPRIRTRGTPWEPLGLSLPPLPLCRGGAQRTSLEALPLFAEGTGSPCSFFAGAAGGGAAVGADGPCWRVWGPPRWLVGGGSPFTARLGEGSLASYMVSSQLSASMGLCCYSSN